MFPPPSLPPAPELFNTSPQKLFPEPSPKDICMNSGMYRCTFLNWIGGVGWMPIWLFLLRCFHRFLFSIDKIHTSMGYSYECTGRFIRFSLSIIMKPVDREI